MALKINNKGGGTDLPQIPADTHQAVCYGLVDAGTHKPKNPAHKPTRKLIMLFELPFERAVFGDKGELPRGISCTLTQSLSDNAILRKFLKSWRGRDFTAQELEGFDLKVLIGQNCNLVISNNPSNDGKKTFANIDGILPLRKEKKKGDVVLEAGQVKQPQENKSLYFDLDEHDLTNLQFPENMPKWIQQKITFSAEVVAANGGEGAQDDAPSQDEDAARLRHEEEARKYDERSRSPQTAPVAPVHQETMDEDVPF